MLAEQGDCRWTWCSNSQCPRKNCSSGAGRGPGRRQARDDPPAAGRLSRSRRSRCWSTTSQGLLESIDGLGTVDEIFERIARPCERFERASRGRRRRSRLSESAGLRCDEPRGCTCSVRMPFEWDLRPWRIFGRRVKSRLMRKAGLLVWAGPPGGRVDGPARRDHRRDRRRGGSVLSSSTARSPLFKGVPGKVPFPAVTASRSTRRSSTAFPGAASAA